MIFFFYIVQKLGDDNFFPVLGWVEFPNKIMFDFVFRKLFEIFLTIFKFFFFASK